MTKHDPTLERLAAEIGRLSPPEKLRLAAGLLDEGRPEMAFTIAERVVLELGAALALKELRRGR